MTESLTYVELDIPAFAAGPHFAATRARWLTSSTGTKNDVMSRTGHRAWADISQLYVYVQNSRLSPVNILFDLAGEVGLGATATVKASIEYPAGTFTQVLFSGSATGNVTDKQILKSDLVTLGVTIPRGEIFWVRQFWHNANGIIYNAWQDSATYGDAMRVAATGDSPAVADQTLSGTIVDNCGWSFPPAAIIADTFLPSIGVVGDSIAYGNAGPTGGEAAPYIGDTGTIAKSLIALAPIQILAASGASANAASAANRYWISSGQPRRELVQYCTQIISELGIVDLNGDVGTPQTALQLIDHLSSFWAALRDSYGFSGTIAVSTMSPHADNPWGDGFKTTDNQDVTFENPERVAFNEAVRAGLPNTVGSYDVAALLESGLNSGKWAVGGGWNWLSGTDGFTGSWLWLLASLSGGQADPFGGTSASKLTEDNTSGIHLLRNGVNGITGAGGTVAWTLSVYAKSSTRRLQIRLAGSGGTDFVYVVFDLVNGQVGTSGTGGSGFALTSSAIVAAGGGFYRCSMVIANSSLAFTYTLTLDNGTGTGALSQSYLGDNASNATVYGPQIDRGATLNPYTSEEPFGLTTDGLHPNNAGYQYVVDQGPLDLLTTPSFRFAVDAAYLPADIDCIPSIKQIDFTPATVSLGGDLGQRAVLSVTFFDHKHIFAGEDFDSGTFWGKFRARYGLKLRGYDMRWIQGTLGQALADMETRHFLIESSDGPSTKGEFKIVAKDILKFAGGDRSQAPVLSNGFLLNNITNVAATLTLSPTGIGSEYPASGYAAIGGKEIVSFTKSGDVLTIVRAQFNTVAQAGTAGDRVQLCLQYSGQDVADIIRDLLVTYSGVDAAFISLASWQAETSGFLGTVYTALIAEPAAVSDLISELIEQAALALWWDDLQQRINLQVLRQISTVADTYDQDNVLENSLDVSEQPDKRISQVYTYFGKINPLVNKDQVDNYRSTAFTSDPTAEVDYGTPAIKKIFSRWIPAGGRSIAEILNNKQLGRYRDPPRRFKFDLFRYSWVGPILGHGYQLMGWPLQLIDGTPDTVPIQVTRLNPKADVLEVEAEEALFTPFGGDVDPGTRVLIFDANENNINLRTRHDELYPAPQSGDVVTAYVNEGVVIGSATSSPAVDVGTWPGGVSITLIVNGRIEGRGGAGGAGAAGLQGGPENGHPGVIGGTALYLRTSIFLNSLNGEIWGGGGGGGGGAGIFTLGSGTIGGGGGGGGAGQQAGAAGAGGLGTTPPALAGNNGTAGTDTAGGAGGPGAGNVSQHGGTGGNGGGPGLAGSSGNAGALGSGGNGAGGAGGAAGIAVDGDSFTINVGAEGDIRGAQVN